MRRELIITPPTSQDYDSLTVIVRPSDGNGSQTEENVSTPLFFALEADVASISLFLRSMCFFSRMVCLADCLSIKYI